MEAATARAPKPALITVDDDAGVARAVQRDLRRRYGSLYQVLSVPSGQVALDVLGRLVLRSQPVAMMVADRRMPGMSDGEIKVHSAPGDTRFEVLLPT